VCCAAEPPPRRVVAIDPSRIVEEPENHLRQSALVTASEHGPDVSVTWVHIAGRHRRLRTRRSTRVYVLLSGELTVQVGDEPPATIAAGGAAVVPRGTPYEVAGTATYLVINAPAFVAGDDEYDDAER
jgi:mannose-6-phosphate isomerase-like protein (cupin superfamily)